MTAVWDRETDRWLVPKQEILEENCRSSLTTMDISLAKEEIELSVTDMIIGIPLPLRNLVNDEVSTRPR